jgi:hypothetical protein
LLFRDKKAYATAGAHGADEKLIANHVELLLFVACGVGGAFETGELFKSVFLT